MTMNWETSEKAPLGLVCESCGACGEAAKFSRDSTHVLYWTVDFMDEPENTLPDQIDDDEGARGYQCLSCGSNAVSYK